MRGLVLLIAGITLFAGAPAGAKTYPNDMDAFSAKFEKAQRNFNKRSTRKSGQNNEYPEGKNATQIPSQKVVSTPAVPQKTICVGNDCGCSSGKGR